MKNESFFEASFALRTIDRFLGAAALQPEITNYNQFQHLVRNEFDPLPAALSSLIRCHGKYTDHNSFNRQTRYVASGQHGKLAAVIDHIGDSSREMITISHRTKRLPILGARINQYVTFDQGVNGTFDVASSVVRAREHFFFMPNDSDDPARLTRFVQIAAPLIEKFADSLR